MNSSESPPIRERAWAEGGRNTLVLAPAFSGGEDDLCASLLAGAPPAEANHLWVTFSDGAAGRLAAWDDRREECPGALGIVEVGGGTGERGAPDAEGVETLHLSRPGASSGPGSA